MKVTLTHDGKSVELDLTAEQMTALGLKEEKKKTGYERASFNGHYFTVNSNGTNTIERDCCCPYDNSAWDNANYYTDRTLAHANARADRLMRQLRRFAAENGGIPSVEDWADNSDFKKFIHYNACDCRLLGVVYFNDEGSAEKAIEKFHDELIWYFTEYEAMLR